MAITSSQLTERFSHWQDESDDNVYVPEKYFSGSDVRIYIGDKEVIEVAAISFNLMQQLRPIYGYKSYTFDAMAIGNRIITGQLTIPFIKKNYLQQFFAEQNTYNIPGDLIKVTGNDYSASQNAIKKFTTKSVQGLETVANAYIERRYGIDASVEVTEDKIISRLDDPAYFNDELLMYENVRDYLREIRKTGFNIYVGYGKDNAEYIAEKYYSSTFSLDKTTDISTILNKGIEKIQGVFLRGSGKSIEVEGTVYETYSFIAKDIY